MPYPKSRMDCDKLLDATDSEDGIQRLSSYKNVGHCDHCPLAAGCVGPELFGLSHATAELRKIQTDLNSTSLTAVVHRRAMNSH